MYLTNHKITQVQLRLNGIIPNSQFGFRPQSSCEMALLKMTDSWIRQVDSGKFVGALLLDLSKAFDTISHQKLLLKLQSVGLSTEAISFLFSYLSDRWQRVVTKNDVAAWKPVNRGVPQGSSLSSLLFNLLIWDLPTFDQIGACQYANATNESTSADDLIQLTEKLTESLQVTQEYCTANGMILNGSKA